MVDEKAKTIVLKADSDREFFLIHGYTGSPTDFNDLPTYLHKKFNATVKIIRLQGHGSRVEDLDQVTFRDLLFQIETELKKDLDSGKKIILGGVSLGALFALVFASKYSVCGVIDVCPPYFFRFPFNIKGLGVLGWYKKYWRKARGRAELRERQHSFSYKFMHANGLKISKQANGILSRRLKKIQCPILSIHSYTDPIGHHKSVQAIHQGVRSFVQESKLINTRTHNVFFSRKNDEVYQAIVDFVEKNELFSRNGRNRVAAIIPAFNEAARIGNVLKVVTKSKVIDEVIVIDDGSEDNTYDVVSKFKQVKYLRNEKNIGKAGSMNRGVAQTKAEVIFFCDADLIGLNQKIVAGIVNPVKKGDFNMFIGIRGNLMQRTIHLFAINSGERALRRVIWESLPEYFKYKYRVEAGLNYYVKHYLGGFGWKIFDYSNPIKEEKYGFFRGLLLRISMSVDVLSVYVRDFFAKLTK